MASLDSYNEEQVMPGTQLDKIKTFKVRNDEEVNITAIMVDFSRLIQSKTSVDVVKGVSNRNLLHAAVALYDVSLSDMTPDVLYCSVCDKCARTIMLLRDIDGTLQDMKARHQKHVSATSSDSTCFSIKHPSELDQPISEATSDTLSCDETGNAESDEDFFQPEENKPCTFAEVFSDTEEEEEEEEEDNKGESEEAEEEEEDFSKGMHSFLRNIADKRKRLSAQKTPITRDDVGIENRLIAAMTFEKKFVKPCDTIAHLTLLAVRQRFRKYSIGKYLVQQLKTPSVVGRLDAVVVHADNSAVAFFGKCGFSDDVILNKRWSELAEQYTHCTLMCSLQPFTRDYNSHSSPELDLKAMASEILKWRSKCVEAYQAEMSCMVRMQQEIIHLRAVVSSQQDLIEALTAKNEQLQCEKFFAEKDFLKYRLQVQLGLQMELHGSDVDSDFDKEALNKELKKARLNHCLPSDFTSNVKLFVLQSESETKEIHLEDDDALEFQLIIHDFYESLSFEEPEAKDYKILSVTKAVLPDSVSDICSASVAAMSDPTLVTNLYFCGSCPDPQRILQTGFTDQDLIHGSFGTGLYFSKYPSTALLLSKSEKLIVAEVGLGNIRSVTTGDPVALAPPTGYDSLLIPGRVTSVFKDSKRHQEYVIYSVYQSRPLFLIECLSCQT